MRTNQNDLCPSGKWLDGTTPTFTLPAPATPGGGIVSASSDRCCTFWCSQQLNATLLCPSGNWPPGVTPPPARPPTPPPAVDLGYTAR
ncbi:hypothetical protein MUP32_00420 [Candidatus Microgenomates bacterium]|nr:hypothetical protein [Candidatus Microgenomates bacterium]